MCSFNEESVVGIEFQIGKIICNNPMTQTEMSKYHIIINKVPDV